MDTEKLAELMHGIQHECLDTFVRKNQDYGNAFAYAGAIGVMIRLRDKIDRFLSISRNGITLVEDEDIENTFLDLCNYAAMTIMMLREGVNYEKEQD